MYKLLLSICFFASISAYAQELTPRTNTVMRTALSAIDAANLAVCALVSIPLVTVHEFGHALAAKAVGMQVDNISLKFYSFSPSLNNIKCELNPLNTPVSIEFSRKSLAHGWVKWSSLRFPINSPEYRKRVAVISLAGPITGLLFGGIISFMVDCLDGNRLIYSMRNVGIRLLTSLIFQEGAMFFSIFKSTCSTATAAGEAKKPLKYAISHLGVWVSVYYMIVNWGNIFNLNDNSDGVQFIKALCNQPKHVQAYKNLSHIVYCAGSLQNPGPFKLRNLSRLALGFLAAGIQIVYSFYNSEEKLPVLTMSRISSDRNET